MTLRSVLHLDAASPAGSESFIQWRFTFPLRVMAAAVAEALWLRTRHSWLTGVVRFCVVLGTLGAMEPRLGWVNASFHTPSQLLTTHRWLGTIAVLWAIPLAALCEGRVRRSARPRQTLTGSALRGSAFKSPSSPASPSSESPPTWEALVYGADYLKF